MPSLLTILIPIRCHPRRLPALFGSVYHTVNELKIADRVNYVLVHDLDKPYDVIADKAEQWADLVKQPVTVLAFTEHSGYSRALAYGLAHSMAPSVLLLSADMLLTPACLSTLLAVFGLHTDAGSVRPVSPRLDDPEVAPVACPHELKCQSDVDHFSMVTARRAGLDTFEQSWLIGDCALLCRAAVDETGGADCRYKNFLTDVDLGLRMQRAGWKTLLAHGAWLHHEGAAMVTDHAVLTGLSVEALDLARQHDTGEDFITFRKKWGVPNPERPTGLAGIDFASLRAMPRGTYDDIHELDNPAPRVIYYNHAG